MSKVSLLLAGALLALAVVAPGGASAATPVVEVGGRAFVGGGTPLTNGLFFPGTGLNDGSQIQWAPPVQLVQGTDLELVNTDESIVSNAHRLVSFKHKAGRPLFASDVVNTPGQTSLVTTSNLKPGIYEYFCSIHSGMLGRIEITKS